jgi:hypothetical protein
VGGEHGAQLGRDADVRLHHERATTSGVDLGRYATRGRQVIEMVHGHPSAFAAELERDGAADARCGAGHDRDLPLESAGGVHGSSK